MLVTILVYNMDYKHGEPLLDWSTKMKQITDTKFETLIIRT